MLSPQAVEKVDFNVEVYKFAPHQSPSCVAAQAAPTGQFTSGEVGWRKPTRRDCAAACCKFALIFGEKEHSTENFVLLDETDAGAKRSARRQKK